VGAKGTDLLEAIFDVDANEGSLDPLFSPEENFFERAQIMTQQSATGQTEPGRSRTTSVAGGTNPLNNTNVNTTANNTIKDPNSNGQLRIEALNIPTSPPRQPRSAIVPSTSGIGGVITPSNTSESNRLRKRSQTPARARPISMVQPIIEYDEDVQPEFRSPLARLFSSAARKPPRPIDFAPSNTGVEEALIAIKKMEGMMESLKEDRSMAQKLRADVKELQERQARIESLLLTLTRGMRGEPSTGGK
jgi:hypothetical protein